MSVYMNSRFKGPFSVMEQELSNQNLLLVNTMMMYVWGSGFIAPYILTLGARGGGVSDQRHSSESLTVE